jgi:hypothetical protein
VDGKVVTRSFNTITGPADGKRLLTGLRLVPSGAENVYIGIDRSTVWRIDANGERVNEAATNPDLADWSMGVAYDSQENVVDLVTLGGEGFMYQRNSSGTWSLLRSMDNKDLESLVYRAADNALYGIEVYNGAPDQAARLLKYSPSSGEKLDEIALPPLPVNLRPGDHTAKLVAVEGKIVALIERIPESYMAAGDHSRIYVIDPTTGAAELTYDNEPGHQPTVTFLSPQNESSVTVNTAITLQIQAADPDNDLRFIILREEPAELRMWSLDPSPVGVYTTTYSYTPRTVGTHTIEVAVNDQSGRIAKATLTLIATNPPPPVPEEDIYFGGWYFKDNQVIGVDYTEKGPKDGGTLYRGSFVAKANDIYLGRDGHTIFRWDNEHDLYQETSPGGDFSWPRGTAFDVKRNRFLVVTLVGEGALYAVQPTTLEWTTIASMQNVDVDSIVYHVPDDHIYMVENHGGNVRILRYNSEGAQVGSFSIPNVPLEIGSSYQSRLISAGTKIALLIEPTPGWGVNLPAESRIYLIDPVAQSATLTYRKLWETWPPAQPANTAPVVTFKQPTGDISVSRFDKVNIVVEVSDAENDLHTATLLLAGTTLKTWTFDNAQGAQSLTFELSADQLGSRPIYLRATDAKGNLTEASVNLTVTDTDVSFVGWYYKDQDAIAVDYTEKGPVDGGTLFRGLPVAQAGYRYLGRDSQTVFRWDDDHEQYTETAPSGEFSWPRGTTWDHRRNRFLVVTLGGEGFLYGVNPETLQWTTITSMQNVDVDSIVYYHLDDHLYMVANLHSGGTLRILRYNAEGQPEGEGIRIPDVPFDIGGYYQSRLISVGTKIALLIEPTPRWPQTPPIESRIYILDPVARTAELTYRKVWETWPPNPNPPPRIPDVAVERDLPEAYTPGASLTVHLKATPTVGVNAWAIEEIPPKGWAVGSISHEGAFDNVSGKIKWGPFTDTQIRTLEYSVVPPAGAVGPKTFSGFVSVNGTSKSITGDTTISGGSRYHPADAPTQDSRITANELTAYAAAWKSGALWPRPPANIPISYVTRAGQIWKSGEFYTYNPALTPPNCWLPTIRELPIAGVAASPAINEVTRTLPPAFTPGHVTTVSVTVRPAAGVQSYAIEERPPAGWTIAQAEGAAAVNGSLRYGPFLDGQTRTFNYQVVPSTTSTAGEFTGTASFDGSADGVQGGCVLTAPNCTAEHRDGQVYLRFNATPGENFILESATSIDSAIWDYEATIQGVQSSIELPPVEPSAKLKFYRLRPLAQ